MNTIAASFNTTVTQITEMSVTKMSPQKNDQNISAKKKQVHDGLLMSSHHCAKGVLLKCVLDLTDS